MANTATKTAPLATATLSFKKETPGAVQYQDDTEGTAVPTLYVRKTAFVDGVFPQSIEVTVTAV